MTPEEFKTRTIKDYIKSQIGAPVVDAVDEEISAIQMAINLALLTYWQAFPYLYQNFFYNDGKGNVSIHTSNLMETVFVDPKVREQAYFLGITRLEPNSGGVPTGGGTNIDSYLLGVPMYASQWNNDNIGNVFEIKKYATQVGMVSGVPELHWDHIADTITITTSGIFGQLFTEFAFGFTDQTGLRYLKTHQLDLFRKMAAVEFLGILESARGQVTLPADFTLDVGLLTKKKETLSTEVTKTISDQVILPMGWG